MTRAFGAVSPPLLRFYVHFPPPSQRPLIFPSLSPPRDQLGFEALGSHCGKEEGESREEANKHEFSSSCYCVYGGITVI